ncbi:MAG: PSD1 and planctomycete cytochrome C domain-containing protein [Rubripirellula sp.]|nr:PSD1 and planctomycete cytochrome C domain-containing protein [Rubripirellula sp.]
MKLCFRVILAVWLAVSATTVRSTAAEPSDSAKVDFIKKVQPILAKKCYACHGPDEAESGLRFDQQASAFGEAESGDHAIVAGDIAASELIARIKSDDEFERMPPEGDPVTPEEIEILSGWIEQGAEWDIHWAFKPMQSAGPPKVDDPAWSQNPIDAFIYDGLHRVGLQPNAPADRRELIRRAFYDITGLPPTAEQVDRFVNDSDPLAFEKLIDEQLDSHHYGERWGRHWLDLVRYAETNSYERDGPKPNAWKYRDYVIRSFNDDKPYDQFLQEQLAGDELDEVTPETLTATGYYRLGIWDDEPADPLLAKYDELDDIIMTTGQAMLGLTINCARCHDHKIDPIPQSDYYSLLAMMADVTSWGTRGDQRSNNQIDVTSDELSEKYQANDKQRRKLEADKREIEQAGIAKMSAPDQRATEGPKREREQVLKRNLKDNLDDESWKQYQAVKKELADVVKQGKELPPRETVMGLAKTIAQPKQTFVLFRGNPHSPADPVEPRFPTIFESEAPTSFPKVEGSAGRRRVLAEWMTSSDNRLTARVIANRVWQFHFGRGIVRSSNNFGLLGTPPTHPELLDWLALRLIEDGWKLKSLHRLIMTSRAYQMSSAGQQKGLSQDPNNEMFWRFDPRRLSAEEVRDSLLAVNGSLNRKAYGPSIYPKLSREVLAGQSRPGSGWGNSSEQDRNRRSVYIHVKRSLLTPLLTAFDFPDPDLTCEDRFDTLQPGQALSLLNSEFIHDQARRVAALIGVTDKGDLEPNEIVTRCVAAVLGREATSDEIADGKQLIEDLVNRRKLSPKRAAELYCLTVLNWNEFLFVD